MKRFTAIAAALTIAFALCAGACAAEKPQKFVPTEPVMPLSQIKPGMTGYAKTVFSGTKITPFEISVIGVLPRKTSPKNLIVIEVKDEYVRAHGGIAAGMSGSPVYIDGKLIGAIGYGWTFADSNLGMVTPIEEMVQAMEWKDEIPDFKIPPVPLEKPLSADVKPKPAAKDKTAQKTKTDKKPEVAGEPKLPAEGKLEKKMMPLMVDGISERMSKRLEKQFGVEVVPFGTKAEAGSPVNLGWKPEPGAAIGAALAWGDFSAGGIGTLTALSKDGRFIAFAHPMFNRGAVSYAMTEAGIVKIIPSLTSSFKLGYIDSIAGVITQDRPQAIGGRLGRLAAAYSYTVNFKDADTGRSATKRFQTVADPFIGPELGATGIVGLIDAEWSRKGQGTAMLTYSVDGGNMKPAWARRDIFFSEKDIVKSLQKEVEAMNKVIAHNKFREIAPYGVTVNVELTQEPRIVYVEKIEIRDKKELYSPGDKLTVDVTFRPWRKDAVVKTFELTVPENAMAFCEVTARGGGIEEPVQEPLVTGTRAITSFKELIRELSAKEANNQLIVEIGGPEDPTEGKDEKAEPGKNRGKLASDATAGKDGGKDKAGSKAGAQRGKKNAKESFSPADLLEDRFVSEIKAERIKSGALVIADTNYYVDGVQRTFIKIKPNVGGEEMSDEQLAALIAAVQSSKSEEKVKTAGGDDSESPDGDGDEDDGGDDDDGEDEESFTIVSQSRR
ncbi:MAG TPA: hypothetical protein IAD35_03890 [Candidatus Caccocola faecigallinarum]|nr:hypothetical protein [Candidatus Caccocola faecigallinarum]